MTQSSIKNILISIATVAIIARELFTHPFNVIGTIISVVSVIVIALVLFVWQPEVEFSAKSDIYLLFLVLGITGAQFGDLIGHYNEIAISYLANNMNWWGLLFIGGSVFVTLILSRPLKKVVLIKRLIGVVSITLSLAFTLGGNLNVYDYFILGAIISYYLFTATLNDIDSNSKAFGRNYWITLITIAVFLARRLLFPSFEYSENSLMATLNFKILPFYVLIVVIIIAVVLTAIDLFFSINRHITNDMILFCGIASLAVVAKCCVYFHFAASWLLIIIGVIVLIGAAIKHASNCKKKIVQKLDFDDFDNPLFYMLLVEGMLSFVASQICYGHFYFVVVLGLVFFIIAFFPGLFTGWHEDFAKSFAYTFSFALLACSRVITVGYSLNKILLIVAIFLFATFSLFFVDHNNEVGHNDFKEMKAIMIFFYALLLIIPIYKGGSHVKIKAENEGDIVSNYVINPTTISISSTADGKANEVVSMRYVFCKNLIYDTADVVNVDGDTVTVELNDSHLIVWVLDTNGMETRKDFWFEPYSDSESVFGGNTLISRLEKKDKVELGCNYTIYNEEFYSGVIEARWWDYEDAMLKTGVYDGRITILPFSIEVEDTVKDPVYYAFYYSDDAYFDRNDLLNPVFSNTVVPKKYDSGTYYDIEFSGNIKQGFYVVVVASDESLNVPYVLAYAEVRERTEPVSPASNDQNRLYIQNLPGNIFTYEDGYVGVDNSLFGMTYSEIDDLFNGNLSELQDWNEGDLDAVYKAYYGPISLKFNSDEVCVSMIYHYSSDSFYPDSLSNVYSKHLGESDSVTYDQDTGDLHNCVWYGTDVNVHICWEKGNNCCFVEYEATASVIEN